MATTKHIGHEGRAAIFPTDKAKDPFYQANGAVFKRPVSRPGEKQGTRQITMGFKVLELAPHILEEGPGPRVLDVVVMALNAAFPLGRNEEAVG